MIHKQVATQCTPLLYILFNLPEILPHYFTLYHSLNTPIIRLPYLFPLLILIISRPPQHNHDPFNRHHKLYIIRLKLLVYLTPHRDHQVQPLLPCLLLSDELKSELSQEPVDLYLLEVWDPHDLKLKLIDNTLRHFLQIIQVIAIPHNFLQFLAHLVLILLVK